MKRICKIAACLGVLGLATAAHAINVDFEGNNPGTPVDFAGFGTGIFAVSAVNNSGGPGIATVTNTEGSSSGDLKYPYAGGNLAGSRLRKVLIVPSSLGGQTPDSQGGQLTLTFFNPVKSFGFDVVDVDQADAANTFVTFRFQGSDIVTIPFSEFKNMQSPYKRPTVQWGNDTANRIAPYNISDLTSDPSIPGIDEVIFDFPSEMAFDNINYRVTVPEPTAIGMIIGVPALAALRRRRKA